MANLTKEKRREIHSPIVILSIISIILGLSILTEATFLIISRG